jgi:DNA-binding transcriptional MocR family regulator
MSWKALDWATDINVGSPTMRLILILLANKADEQFSCYPSVRTLMAESCAARSTVLNALNRLEREGLITRVAQYHESGAQRCSLYFLNHPDAAHLKAGPNPVRRRDGRGLPPRPGGSKIWTPRGSDVQTP